ncbi:hypothetical protein Q8G38_12670 [Halomonas venusta]|uniref:hypothetical protein n=1 Tax=Vreelandella venusta TaxID=44935 RepID=UPI00295F01FF|nr:hypothetical protein [Halomonas venusta]MDW0360167.1 hypothetical protein [Halomonas venusta]
MKLTRRQLLRNGLLLGSAAPLTIAATWAGQAVQSGPPVYGEISLYGEDRSTTELGLGLRQKGWTPRYEGRLDPLVIINALPRGALAAGFTDEAGLVLLTSMLKGRGRILALGRHDSGQHYLLSHRGTLDAELATRAGSWQSALGREYARLAQASMGKRSEHRFQRSPNADARELSFLVQV